MLLFAGAVLVPGAVSAQEVAGSVLVSVGDVTILRDGQKIPARFGTEVRSGDTVELGPQAVAQVRFTDESLVALGSDTSFRVSEYAFQKREPGAQRAFFNLIKGGMRTITGLIGHTRRQDYRVETPTATIGIRGSGYAACQDCTTTGGAKVPGTIVNFSEGQGSLLTKGGELLLETGQTGYAATATAAPVPTLSFPRLQQDAKGGEGKKVAAAQPGSAPAAGAKAATTPPGPPAGGPGTQGVVVPVLGPIVLIGNPNLPIIPVSSASSPVDLLSGGNPFQGTVFYRLTGPFNIPTSCSSPPCSTAVAGEFTLGVNFALQRATANAAIKLVTGEIFNLGIPINLSGVPITINGSQASFSGTFNLADFPNNQGSFSCSNCGPNSTQGFAAQLTVSGTITGSQATVTFGGTNTNMGGGGSGSITVTLTQEAPPNNSAAAIATPVLAGGTDHRSAAYWNVQLDSSGRLLNLGPVVGEVQASVGGATNTIVGTAPTAGNLVWGTWTNGSTAATKATITDNNYATFQPSSGSVQPWITGDASNSLPPSLGTLTFTPVGSVFSSSSGRLNSGSLTADFVNRSLNLSLNATNTSAGNTFQMNATTGFSPTSSRFSGNFNSVTCSGPCSSGGGTLGGGYGGFFSGAQAQGAGVAFSAGFGTGSGGVTGAAAFKR
jgi:hypothetical protein